MNIWVPVDETDHIGIEATRDENDKVVIRFTPHCMLCKVVTVETRDQPTAPGWWAFKGYSFQGTPIRPCEVTFVRKLELWEITAQNERRYRWEGDSFSHIMSIAAFRKTYVGEWYRIHMPWENNDGEPK